MKFPLENIVNHVVKGMSDIITKEEDKETLRSVVEEAINTYLFFNYMSSGEP